MLRNINNETRYYSVMIFYVRSGSPIRVHLYYISFYLLRIARFHTKYLLIYLFVRESKG